MLCRCIGVQGSRVNAERARSKQFRNRSGQSRRQPGAMEHRLREQIIRLFGFSVCVVSGFIGAHEVLLGTSSLGWSLMVFALSLWAMIQFLLSPRTMDFIATAFLLSTFVLLAGIVIGSGGRALGANVAIPTFLVLSTMLVKTRTATLVVGMGYLFLLGLAAVLAATDYPYPIAIKPENAAMAVYRLPIVMSILAALVIFPFKSAIIRLNEKYVAALAKEQQLHKLRKSHEEQLAEIALLRGGWFWSADRNMKIDYLSPGFSHFTGIDCEAAMQTSPEELASMISGESALKHNAGSLEKGKSYSETDFVFRNSSNRLQIVESAGQPLLDGDGDLMGYIGVALDVTQLREVQGKLRALREVDPETGLANGNAMSEALDLAAHSAKMDFRRHVVCVIRIVHGLKTSKTVDRQTLTAVAQLLKESVRTQDLIGRTADQEFCVLLRDYGSESASKIPERIVSAIRQMSVGDDNPDHYPMAFAGVAMLAGRSADAEATFTAARQACDESSKSNSKDVYFAASFDAVVAS